MSVPRCLTHPTEKNDEHLPEKKLKCKGKHHKKLVEKYPASPHHWWLPVEAPVVFCVFATQKLSRLAKFWGSVSVGESE